MSPPENGRGATPGKVCASSEKLTSNSPKKVQQPSVEGNLFGGTEQKLIQRGAKYALTSSGDLRVVCPWGGGKMLLDPKNPWAICFCSPGCVGKRASFEAIILGLR